jgi:hypothetical protein
MRVAHAMETKISLEARPACLAASVGMDIKAELSYLKPTSERPYNYMYEPASGIAQQNCEYEARMMQLTDARRSAARPSVHGEGFELREAPSIVRDFRDDEAVISTYYNEMAELARAVTGAARAYVFDHVVRKREAGRPPLTFGRHGDGRKPAAAGRIHNDYTEDSGRKRLSVVLKDASAEQVARYSIVNIWRSISGPILDTPLALCDARTVSNEDLVVAEVRYPTRTGEIYLVQYSSRHQWFYFSEMDRHEALIFKQYDSHVGDVARYTPHAAFDLPDTPPHAPLRESIELRCLLIYE